MPNTKRTIEITELELVTLTDLARLAIDNDFNDVLTLPSKAIVQKFRNIAGEWILERAGYIK